MIKYDYFTENRRGRYDLGKVKKHILTRDGKNIDAVLVPGLGNLNEYGEKGLLKGQAKKDYENSSGV